METASGTIIHAKEALRLNPNRLSEISITAKYLPIVVESKVEGLGYSSLYLDSLNVPTVKMSDVNSLWSKMDKAQYPEIITIAVELKKLDLSESGLLIYDLENEKLRPATEFRLGKKGAKGVPLLENQYGAIGRTLGELLRLPEENDGTSYLELFKQMVEDKLSWGSSQQLELFHLLKLWQSFEANVRAQISAAFQQTWCSAGFDSAPVLIINDPALTKLLRRLLSELLTYFEHE